MEERRTAERVRLTLQTHWETLTSEGRGSTSDLSSMGCFVLTGGEVFAGELVRLEVFFGDRVLTLWGEVVYHIAEMGFAIRFQFENEAERQRLTKLIERFGVRPEPPAT